MIAGEQSAGASEASLDFVTDQQDVAPATDLGARCEVALRRDDNAALPLDRFDNERGGARRDGRLERSRIRVIDEDESGRERTEMMPVLGL